MWALDLTHTSHSSARTGIQQVCREIHAHCARSGFAQPVVYDRFARHWRLADSREIANLHSSSQATPANRRGSQWSTSQKLRGVFKRWTRPPPLPDFRGIILPEIFDHQRYLTLKNSFPDLPKIALFYDAIPLSHPELTPTATVLRFPGYLREVAGMDRIFPISQTSAQDLLREWEKLGTTSKSQIEPLPLGVPSTRISDSPGNPMPQPPPFHCLMIGTFEGRKNQISLLMAAERLWNDDRIPPFTLTFIGMVNTETGSAAIEKLESLWNAGRPVQHLGALPDSEIARNLRNSHLLIYPSLYEGFGLPVLEALANKVPVVCSDTGALPEIAMGGGCLTCAPTADAIADTLRHLFNEKPYQLLANEARQRPIRTMAHYCDELMEALSVPN